MRETLYDYLNLAAAQHPAQLALMHKVQDEYVGTSYHDLVRDVDSVAANLRALGLRKGDSVGIFSGNRPEWVMADLAATKLGCVVVPIHPGAPASFVSYVAISSGIKLLFIENEKLLQMIQHLPDHLVLFKMLVLFDGVLVPTGTNILPFAYLRTAPQKGNNDLDVVCGNDIATVVYTSGTTGEPKGVLLSHHNIVSNALAIQSRFDINTNDVTLSYLPLSHMFERTCGYYAFIIAGASIAYAESAATLIEDIKSIRPTILLAVPSVIEKAYHRVVSEVSTGSLLKRTVISLAIKLLNAYSNRAYKNRRIPNWLRAAYGLSNRYVALRFRQLGGGRLRIVASGGAPLDKKVAKLYHIIGFNIVEGYGLTETSPIVACHTIDDRTLGTVGKPLEGVEVRIGSQNEILVRGPNVMQGYLHRPEDTARVIDMDGWFHTGDQGRFDRQNNLIITGRIKDIIVLSNGEKVAVAMLESRLMRSEYVVQAVVFGDKKKFVSALIVPDRGQIERFAADNNIQVPDYTQLLRHRAVCDLIARQLDRSSIDMLPHEKVKAFALIPEPFTIENGCLTLTLKFRRARIEELYKDCVGQLYESRPSVPQSRAMDAEHAN